MTDLDLPRVAFAARRHWDCTEGWIELWPPTLTIAPGSAGEVEANLLGLDGATRALTVMEMAR